jgi:hypothetical protein
LLYCKNILLTGATNFVNHISPENLRQIFFDNFLKLLQTNMPKSKDDIKVFLELIKEFELILNLSPKLTRKKSVLLKLKLNSLINHI